MPETAPASVLIPTIGRLQLLEGCLRSLARCDPRAEEILVLDQSGDAAVLALVKTFTDAGAHASTLTRRGKGRALNHGLRLAKHDLILIVDDDCVVAADWVGRAEALFARDPEAIFTGRVLPAGDPSAIPSTIVADEPAVWTGGRHTGHLYGNNMACHRLGLLAVGGFDELIVGSPTQAASEDNDLCYRWLRLGRRLRYQPELIVWHLDWRRPEQLRTLYVDYARGQGMFYAKHLRQGDWRILRFLVRDLYAGARGLAAAAIHQRSASSDWRRGILRGLFPGLIAGWRAYGCSSRSARRARTQMTKS